MSHWSDNLIERVRRQGSSLCVGLDPRWEMLPHEFTRGESMPAPEQVADAYRRFFSELLPLIRSHCEIIKPQMAFFEACGPAGLAALQQILGEARSRRFHIILDAKRGDIASTADAYAEAALSRSRPIWDADSLTVNPYLGADAIEPFVRVARREHRGLFVLVKTSNPGGGLFQDLTFDGVPLHEKVMGWVRDEGRQNIGSSGYGDLGAVVGATHPAQLKRLRELAPDVWFLVPGYGAQGGKATDLMAGRGPDGLGMLVNSSRGVTFPFQPADTGWRDRIREAVARASEELKN